MPEINDISAWAAAMMDAQKVAPPAVIMTLRFQNMVVSSPCRTFLTTTPGAQAEELRRYCGKNAPTKLLDIGCGIGRHLEFVRGLIPQALLWGTENDPTLLGHCRQNYGDKIYSSLGEVAEMEFDIVLLLGGNVGLIGSEANVSTYLKQIYDKLKPGGVLIGEGAFLGGDHNSGPLEITYSRGNPVTFPWLFCKWGWLKPQVEQVGFRILKEELTIPEPCGWLFVAQKPQ